MKTLSRAQVKNRVETRTGIIWGTYTLPETFMNDGKSPQPPFHLIFHSRDEGLVRIEGGLARRGFYLSWGEH